MEPQPQQHPPPLPSHPAPPTPARQQQQRTAPPTPQAGSEDPDMEPPTPSKAVFGDSSAEAGPRASVYTAMYSNVPVFECLVRGIAVMRRRSDSWMNATQILKVAGIDKGRRTKILEKDIIPAPGVYEKVQGGYGKYQGTWLPIDRALAIATQYGVQGILSSIFDSSLNDPAFVSALPPGRQGSPTKIARPVVQPRQLAIKPDNGPSVLSPFVQAQHVASFPVASPSHGGRPYDSASTGGTAPPYYGSVKRPRNESMDGMASGSSGAHENSDPFVVSGSMGPPLTKRMRADSVNGAAAQGASLQSALSMTANSVSHPIAEGRNAVAGPSSSLTMDVDLPEDPSSMPLTPLVPFTRFASKPHDPSSNPDPQRQRALLLSLFDVPSSSNSDDPEDPSTLLTSPTEPFDSNLVIDKDGHTALHWACSLSRPNLVRFLLERGADPHRGNYSGETPLIRLVLATNTFESHSLLSLLALPEISGTLRTLDTSRKSVLHHIALVAGVRGRAAAARYYMESVLEWIAINEGVGRAPTGGQGFRTIVDIMDMHGDTALNIAARVGNRSLVRLLLDVGADKTLANNVGLRPGDFGIEEKSLEVSPAESLVSAIRSNPLPPVQKSKDVIADMTKMIESLNTSFLAEVQAKDDVLTTTRTYLKAAIVLLAATRREQAEMERQLSDLDEIEQRIQNVERALEHENNAAADWGLAPFASSSAANRKVEVARRGGEGLAEEVRELRKLAGWDRKVEAMLDARIRDIHGESVEKAVRFKKVIAICSGVPLEMVESMLDKLVIAIESDGGLDVSRVAGFMQKIKEQQP